MKTENEKKETGHTPLIGWNGYFLCDGAGKQLLELSSSCEPITKRNKARDMIVRAVNSHAELLEALKATCDALASGPMMSEQTEQTLKEAQRRLAEVEGR